jgi:hypothetical protein
MADPYKNNVVLYLPMEGSRHGDTVFVEKTGKTATRSGAAVLNATTGIPEPFGITHLYCDGAGGYVSFNACPDFDFGSGDWTIEGWILKGSGAATDREWIAHRHSSDTNNVWLFRWTSTNTLRFFAKATSIVTDISTTTTFSVDTWYHVAAVRRSGIVSIYVNGVVQPLSVTTNATSAYVMPNYPLLVGAADNSATADWIGYLKDVRITKGVARYTANFSVSQTTTVDDDYWANVVLAIHGEGTGTTFTDVSNSAKTITTNGNTTHSTAVAPPFGTSSIYFDGTGDYLSLASAADFGFGTGDFTVECWVRLPTNALSAGSTILDIRPAANADDFTFYIANSGSGNRLGYYSNTATGECTNTYLALDTWYHLALVRQSGVAKIYLNGSLQPFSSGSSSWPNDVGSSQPCYVGANPAGTNAITGYIKDLRVTKGVARYTQNFTPKYRPFPDKTAIKTIAAPHDWDNPESVRIIL